MLPDWIELCRLFSARSVEVLLVGEQAVIAHGYPRLTVDFDSAWSGRTVVALDGEAIPVISKADLIVNKKAVGRLQDLADVEALEAVAGCDS